MKNWKLKFEIRKKYKNFKFEIRSTKFETNTKTLNSKSEARNSKQIRIFKIQMFKTTALSLSSRYLSIFLSSNVIESSIKAFVLNFEPCFEFRISDLEFAFPSFEFEDLFLISDFEFRALLFDYCLKFGHLEIGHLPFLIFVILILILVSDFEFRASNFTHLKTTR